MRDVAGDDRLHHAHAGRRRPRPLPAGAGRGAPRASSARRCTSRYDDFMGLGRVEPARPQRAVLHDRAGAQALAARQRRQRAARRGLAADVAAALPEPHRGGGADRPHHQRRPRPDLARAADARCSTTATSAPTGRERQRRPETWERDRRRRRRRAVGDAAGPQGPADRLRPPPAGRARPQRRGEADAAVAAAPTRCSTRTR